MTLKKYPDIERLGHDAWNIIFCDKIKVKKGCKIICKVLIKDRLSLEKKEWKV